MPDKPRIRILPDNLANKIAAGEVVERPSSLVKELVENSIDSGARSIYVEVESGGRRLIRVTDDGCGMTPDDALLSIERHATSKINDESDLFAVRTLGFRGEALPSIAAVSRLEILTRTHDRAEGSRVRIEGGIVLGFEPAGCAPGTMIAARDIFFNVPARKKFLRSANTELANISDVVSRAAIAYPEIHFRLMHDGREIIEAPSAKELGGRLADLLGAGSLASLIQIEPLESPEVKVCGMTSLPELSRSNPSNMYIFVNRRPVRDRMIIHAAGEVYRNFLPRGRYPVMVIFIEVDPAEVDVNVHPSKAEVKFRDSNIVFDAVRFAVGRSFDRRRAASNSQIPSASLPLSINREEGIKNALARAVDRTDTLPKYFPPEQKGTETPSKYFPPEQRSFPPEQRSFLRPATQPRPWGYFSDLDILGQLRSTFIVCQSSEGLLLIDQHAAHERTAFEKLKKEFSLDRIRKQALLFPEIIEFGLKEAADMERNIGAFDKLGIEIVPFGQRAYRVSAIPALLSSSDVRELVIDVIDSLGSNRSPDSFREKIDDIFARMACHAVVRANRKLTEEEINALLVSLDQAEHTLTCPHGRPICVHITFQELEKMFGRK